MKKIAVVLFVLLTFLSLGCGDTAENNSVDRHEEAAALDLGRPVHPPEAFAGKRILVAFFSRTGENYEVGFIGKGNTHIVAEQIAEITKADQIFEIKTVTPYPADYQEMTRVAKEEQEAQARPALASQLEDMAQYDIIYLGYPIWFHDLPMPVYTFLESYDFTGKTIIPFCTGSGNALSGMEEDIPRFAKGAQLCKGFGIQGKLVHNSPEQAKIHVANWLASLGYTN